MEGQKHNCAENFEERQLLLGSFREDCDRTSKCKCLKFSSGKIKECLDGLKGFVGKALEMGRSDPRKIIFAIKMGLALSIVSLLIFWTGLKEDVAQYSIWAILTVIVMFEFSIGATFIKGFNRVLGTVVAGVLAFGFAELSLLAGQWEKIVIVSSIFITGTCSSYLKLYPTMMPYEYGFRVFILTYCILMVAGNRTREYEEAVVTRLVLIAFGAGVCLVVNVCIYPIWAGDALHSLVAKNFEDLAASLEGCINGYLKCVEYERVPSKILSFQAYDDPLYNGYRSVIESTSKESTLLGFAIWEPPHGRFRMFKYPWKNYAKVSGALRHCAFMVMALHGCILSEIQAPAERRLVFQHKLRKVGEESAKVVRKLGNKLDKMEKLVSPEEILKAAHEAAEELQKQVDQKSYLLVNSERWEISGQPKESSQENLLDNNEDMGVMSLSETVIDLRSLPDSASLYSIPRELTRQASWPCPGFKEDELRTYESASALSLATFASLLIEFVARLQNVVDSFEELSEKAGYLDLAANSPIVKKRGGIWISLFRCF